MIVLSFRLVPFFGLFWLVDQCQQLFEGNVLNVLTNEALYIRTVVPICSSLLLKVHNSLLQAELS
jgi:hypothetical protein